MVQRVLRALVKVCSEHTLLITYKTAYTDTCGTHYTIPVYKTVFVKMDPLFRSM